MERVEPIQGIRTTGTWGQEFFTTKAQRDTIHQNDSPGVQALLLIREAEPPEPIPRAWEREQAPNNTLSNLSNRSKLFQVKNRSIFQKSHE
jgi:hypothetical protein